MVSAAGTMLGTKLGAKLGTKSASDPYFFGA